MEDGDRWGMLKCAGGGVQDKTIINQIMLRFRPIAPKPLSGDSISGESTFGKNNLGVQSKRVKRKYVRVCTKNNNRKRVSNEAKEVKHGDNDSVTLQLMPVKSDLDKSTVVKRSQAVDDHDLHRTVVNEYYRSEDPPSPLKKRVAIDREEVAVMGMWDLRAMISSPGVVESWVTVESVTDTCMDEGEMGSSTDVERMRNLKDTCPGFLSDGSNRVFWVNEGYKKMMGREGAETTVGLVVKEGFKFPKCDAFSCRVGLHYGDGNGKKKQSKMVPCDVWKMSFGGFAWRLDVKTALSLGL